MSNYIDIFSDMHTQTPQQFQETEIEIVDDQGETVDGDFVNIY